MEEQVRLAFDRRSGEDDAKYITWYILFLKVTKEGVKKNEDQVLKGEKIGPK